MNDESITVVTGLPRSGTSMMMQMLSSGGARVLIDGKSVAGEVNTRGYVEHEGTTHLHKHTHWISTAKGGAIKVVAQLIPHLPDYHHYKVVFMHRDIDEVLASQEAVLRHIKGPLPPCNYTALAQTFMRQVNMVNYWLEGQDNIDVLNVHYGDVLKDTAAVVKSIVDFLGISLDIDSMVDAVVPGQHNQRRAM